MSKKISHEAADEVSNSWHKLTSFTDARIGLGRAGNSLPTRQVLAFQMDHANARDAVHIPLNIDKLLADLPDCAHMRLASEAGDRATYLQRPDLGRRLSDMSRQALTSFMADNRVQFDVAVVIADGLSSTAVQAHGALLTQHLFKMFRKQGLTLAPLCIVNQGRVALGDEIGEQLGVDLLIVIVGERPGLSSPDSLGIYFTYKPVRGLQDSNRNCISNIRPAGLSFQAATDKLLWLIEHALELNQSGVMLKDQSATEDASHLVKGGNILLG